MKRISSTFTQLLTVCLSTLLVAGCSTVLVHQAYPTHYQTDSDVNCSPCYYAPAKDKKPNTRLLPTEVEAALSDDDRMASMMGYLAILGDPKAKIVLNGQSRSIWHTRAYEKEQAQ